MANKCLYHKIFLPNRFLRRPSATPESRGA